MMSPRSSNEMDEGSAPCVGLASIGHWNLAIAIALGLGLAAIIAFDQIGWITTPEQRFVAAIGALFLTPIAFNRVGYDPSIHSPRIRFHWLRHLHPWLSTQNGTETLCIFLVIIGFGTALLI